MSRLDQLDRFALVGRLGEREALLELPLPVAVGGEREPFAASPLGIELEQLTGQLLRRAPRARLHRLPARATQLRERRMGVGAVTDVARDLRELVGGHVDAVVALVFEVQVVARHACDRAGLEAGETGDAVVLVDDDVARAQVGERAQRPAAARARAGGTPISPLGAAAAEQPVLGVDGELQLRGDEALAQRRRREAQRGLDVLAGDVHVLAEPGRFQAAQVVGGALALAPAREGDDGAVTGAHEAFELRLGFGQRPRRRVRRLRAELDLLSGRESRQPRARTPGQRRRERTRD